MNATVIDNGEFFNVTIDGIEFTADKEAREWAFAGEDNAERMGPDTNAGLFWSCYEPLLNRAVGWTHAS